MISKKGWILLLLLLTNFLVPSSYFILDAQASPITWIIETVDASMSVGDDSSIVIASDGFPHIAYHDWHWKNLKYATPSRVGTGWFIETVDTPGAVGRYPSIALDSSDYLHISYYDNSNLALKYAQWTGSTWSIETVDANSAGVFTSIAVDADGHPHISYLEDSGTGAPESLKYAQWTGSTWSIETVDTQNALLGATARLQGISLALDANGRPHISYTDVEDQEHKYARWTGATWNIDVVDTETGGHVYGTSSLAVDADGHPHISYNGYDEVTQIYTLNYARWTGATWSLETVTDTPVTWVSIALDPYGNPHIAYDDFTHACVGYARWTGSAWSIEAVDSEAETLVGGHLSLALDDEGKPHISYYDSTNGNLKYASTPNEFFRDVNITPYDRDSDGLNDSVHIEMNVDTMDVSGIFEDSVPVEVNAYLVDAFGYHADYTNPHWSVAGFAVDWQETNLSVPLGYEDGPSMYNVELALFDADGFYEDFHHETAFYLYPSSTSPTSPGIMSCTESGDPLSVFEVDTYIFVTGTGFSASTAFDIYVVEDQESWVDGTVLPTRLGDTEARIESNATGGIDPTVVWDPQVLGAFDIVVDINGNGRFDEGVDALDDADIDGTAGFVVHSGDTSTPEISILSPENRTYTSSSVPLSVSVDGATVWMGYSLDGRINATFTGNIQLTELSDGPHQLTVYVEDTEGHISASNHIHFTIDIAPSSFIQTDLVIFIMLGAVVGGLVLIYLIKR